MFRKCLKKHQIKVGSLFYLVQGSVQEKTIFLYHKTVIRVSLKLRKQPSKERCVLTHLDDHGDGCAGLLVPAARPRGDDGSLADLLLRLLGDEDAALRLGRRLRALDQHAVEHRQESLQGAGLEIR